MGKGFNNYMCKKFFHPASRDNLKRVWMAEQKADSYKKKQEELRQQYEKEQDLYTNKAILSKESKDKLSVNFMYEPPPGTKKEREREDDEPEYKFEWQRKFNAPREDYCKGDSEIRDQPFGIQVRNVRCIKCHKWGHINTDKECPMYCRSILSEQESTSYDPMMLVQQMREDGLAMKKSAFASQQHLRFPANQKLLESSDDEDNKDNTESEMEFLKTLTKEQKQRLLKKLEKMERKGDKSSDKKKSKKNKKKKRSSDKKVKKEVHSESSDSDRERRTKDKKLKRDVEKVKIQIKKEPVSSSEDIAGQMSAELFARFENKSQVRRPSESFSDHRDKIPRNERRDDRRDDHRNDSKRKSNGDRHKSYRR